MIESFSQVRVRYAETDQMKFAHHCNYVNWFELARIDLMREYGISYASLEKEGYLLPVLTIQIEYLRPARFDDVITIRSYIEKPPRAKIEIKYSVTNEQGELLSKGNTLHSFMNLKDRAIKPPKMFLNALAPYFDSDQIK